MQKAIRVACTFYIDETQQLALQVHLKKAMWRTTAQAFRELLEKEGNEIIREAFEKLYPDEEFISYKKDNYTMHLSDLLESSKADQKEETTEETEEEIVPIRKVDLSKPSDKKGKAA